MTQRAVYMSTALSLPLWSLWRPVQKEPSGLYLNLMFSSTLTHSPSKLQFLYDLCCLCHPHDQANAILKESWSFMSGSFAWKHQWKGFRNRSLKRTVVSHGFLVPSSKLCQNWLYHWKDTLYPHAAVSLPELVTPLKGHSLSPCNCPLMLSVPSERFGY